MTRKKSITTAANKGFDMWMMPLGSVKKSLTASAAIAYDLGRIAGMKEVNLMLAGPSFVAEKIKRLEEKLK